jgi:hypothetical protein
MDANSGEPWSEADISDLKNELDHGRTIAETASFLCRDVYEVRAKCGSLPSSTTLVSCLSRMRSFGHRFLAASYVARASRNPRSRPRDRLARLNA